MLGEVTTAWRRVCLGPSTHTFRQVASGQSHVKTFVGVLVAAILGLSCICVAVGCAAHDAPRATTVSVEAGATVAPRVVRHGALEIPNELRSGSCTSGLAVAEVQVGATGQVEAVRVAQKSGEPAFDEACARSAYASSYEPGSRFGKPTVGVTRIECRLQCP